MDILGVDLGGTNFRVGLVRGGRLAHSFSGTINADGNESDVFTQLCGMIDREISVGTEGIGVGVPGIADPDTGVVYNVQNIPSWKEIIAFSRSLSDIRNFGCNRRFLPAPLLRETYRFIGACAFRATSVRPQNRQFRLKNLISDRLLGACPA